MAGTERLREVRLSVPLGDAELAALRCGDVVYLDGRVMTAREGVYRKIIVDGETPPLDLRAAANVNFHCSPAAAPAPGGGYRMGAVTATASFRFAKWLPRWFALSGCRVIIGKGGMSPAHYREILVPAGALYLTTVGYGTGALLGRAIREVEAVHWIEELGIAQALWLLQVERFGPLLVESDLAGNSLFERGHAAINERIARAYEGLGAPALSRYGETDDRTRELI